MHACSSCICNKTVLYLYAWLSIARARYQFLLLYNYAGYNNSVISYSSETEKIAAQKFYYSHYKNTMKKTPMKQLHVYTTTGIFYYYLTL